MRGRFVLWITLIIPEHDGFPAPAKPILPSSHIAPGQNVVVHQRPSGRGLARLRRALIPSWIRALKKSPKSINARPKTAWDKPGFRSAIRRHGRCLIPANGSRLVPC